MRINRFRVLIADRNRHVREFLKREFEAEGYQVQVVQDGRQVLAMTTGDDRPDLLILDLDMPYVSGLSILERIFGQESPVPVVVHTLMTEDAAHPAVELADGFWEKKGNNIEGFKAMVGDVLRKCYPERFSDGFMDKRETEARSLRTEL